MTRSPGRNFAVGPGAAVMALAVLAVSWPPAGADQAFARTPARRSPASAAPGSGDPALVGIAAIAGAGIEVRHVMKVKGPDPVVQTVAETPDATPSASAGTPSPSPRSSGPAAPVGGIAAAWHSGAAGDAASDGSFAGWRGEPLQVVGTWSDSTAEEQTDITSMEQYRNWNGDIDVAVGGLAGGETWSLAASGALTERWTQAIRNIKAKRAGRSGTTYVRFAHEMTGDWFRWKVTPGNVKDFKTSWRLFRGILAREFPRAKLVFSPNDGNHSGVPVDQIWPGDEYVDVVGPDSYDGFPDKTSQAVWDESFMSTSNGPQGLGAWQAFALAHGKPMAVPEWGLRSSDNPFFITKMHEFFAGCAPKSSDLSLAGKCIYDIYFNITNSGNSGFVIYGGHNPRAAQVYQSLSWGTR